MSQSKNKFDIFNFCNGQKATCNNVTYSKIVTSGNDPSMSAKMRYSQYLRTNRFKTKRTTKQAPPVTSEIPYHHFVQGQIFNKSLI